MMGDVLGIPLRRESYVEEKTEQGAVMGGFTFDGKAKWMSGSPAEIISRQLDYLEISPWSWHRQDGYMSLGLGQASDQVERTLLITPPVDGQLTLYLVAKRPGGQWRSYPCKTGEIDELMEWAEDYANERGSAALAAKQRRWRSEPPTDAQIKFAKRLRGAWKTGATKGVLAQRITHAIAVQAVGR
jgi:hypothetical protein